MDPGDCEDPVRGNFVQVIQRIEQANRKDIKAPHGQHDGIDLRQVSDFASDLSHIADLGLDTNEGHPRGIGKAEAGDCSEGNQPVLL